jgi:hypothetical protein
MMELYKQLADGGSSPRDVPASLAAQSTDIWSFKNTAASPIPRSSSSYIESDLEFHLQDLPKNEHVLAVHLRLFETFPRRQQELKQVNKCDITITQLSEGGEDTLAERPTAVRLRHALETFNLTQLTEGAIQNGKIRLKVKVKGAFGHAGPYSPSMQQRFINSLDPLLVVYLIQHNSSENQEEWQKLITSALSKKLNKHHPDSTVGLRQHRTPRAAIRRGRNVPTVQVRETATATKRHQEAEDKTAKKAQKKACSLDNLTIDFNELNFSRIIAPKHVNLRSCSGSCSKFNPSYTKSHTLFKLIHHAVFGIRLQVCCIPETYESMRVLIKTDNGSLSIRKYENAIAKSCSCR